MQCCIKECKREAVSELSGRTPDGRRFFIPVCKKDHGRGFAAQQLFNAGKTEEAEAIDQSRLKWEGAAEGDTGVTEFSSHIAAAKAGCPTCKKPLKDLWTHRLGGLVWRNKCQDQTCTGYRDYTVSYEVNPGTSAEKAPAPRRPSEMVQVVEGWAFVDDYNRWRNHKGEVVKIKELENEELLDAMYCLKEANFQKLGATIKWMKSLPRKPEKYRYLAQGLNVGKDLALAKLEEMREVAAEKGLLV